MQSSLCISPVSFVGDGAATGAAEKAADPDRSSARNQARTVTCFGGRAGSRGDGGEEIILGKRDFADGHAQWKSTGHKMSPVVSSKDHLLTKAATWGCGGRMGQGAFLDFRFGGDGA